MIYIDSIEQIESAEQVRRMTFEFNFQEFFCKEGIRALADAIITPFEVFLIAFKEGKLEHINVLQKMSELLGEQRFKNSLLCRMYSFPIEKIILYEPTGVALEKEKNFVITEETKKIAKKMYGVFKELNFQKPRTAFNCTIEEAIDIYGIKVVPKKILEAEKMNLIGVSLEEYANTLKDILQRIGRVENTLID